MLVVLRLCQHLLEFQGYLRTSTTPRYYLVISVVFVLSRIGMIQPMTMFIVSSDNDYVKRVEAMPPMLNGYAGLFLTVHMFRSHRHLVYMLTRLQAHIDNNKAHNNANFMHAHRRTRLLSTILVVGAVSMTSLFTFTPLAVVAFNWIRGTYRPDLWIMPFDVTMPLDITRPSGYLMAFVVQYLFCVCCGLHMMIFDILYFCGCVFALAYVSDLREFYLDADAEWQRRGDRQQLRRRLVALVRQHLVFTEWFEHFAQLSSGFIFFQIGSNAISASTSIFIFIEGYRQFLVVIVWLLLEVFFVCYVSTTVMQKLLATADTLYDSHWYTYPVRQQHFVMLVVQQMQRTKYMSGYGIIECSLQFFSSFVNFLGSMIAVLQSS